MSEENDVFDPTLLLKPELVIKSVDSHLYRIGLCVPTDDCSVKRSFVQKPLIILIILLIETCKIIAFSSISRIENESYRLYFGDEGELSGLGNFYHLISASYVSTTICCMLIHYWNYKKGIKPTYLQVFKVMAGLVPPKTVRLTDKSQLIWLIRRTKLVFKAVNFNNRSLFPIIGFSFSLSGYLRVNSSLFHLFLFGIPNSLYSSLLVIVIYDIQLYQLIYFYIICVYLKLKLQSINANLLEKKSKTSIAYIVSQLKAMNSLYKEINEYNSQFWSLYFLLFWLNIGSIISIELYIIFLSDISTKC